MRVSLFVEGSGRIVANIRASSSGLNYSSRKSFISSSRSLCQVLSVIDWTLVDSMSGKSRDWFKSGVTSKESGSRLEGGG